MSGYFQVRVETDLDLIGVELGGIQAIRLEPDGADAWTFEVQGAPEAGPAALILRTAAGEERFEGAFEYTEPRVPGFERFVAMGASLTQGVQGGVPTPHGQRHAPSRQIAEALGVYHPFPLQRDGLFEPIGVEHIGPPPECEVPEVPAHLASRAVAVLQALQIEGSAEVDFALGLHDAELPPYNLGVGDSNLVDLLEGPDPAEFSQQFLAHLTYDPEGGLTDNVPTSQIEEVEALEPTVIVCFDTYGNDLIGAIVQSTNLDPTEVTDAGELEADMETLVQRMADTGAQVFLANIPRPTLLPITASRRTTLLAEGLDAAEVDARVAAIEAAGVAFNAALDRVAAAHDNVHIVDVAGRIEGIEADGGLVVAGETLQVARFSGLLSTDGVHFSDLGYALQAEAFLEVMGETMGFTPPAIDLETVLANDPYSPSALEASGLTGCAP